VLVVVADGTGVSVTASAAVSAVAAVDVGGSVGEVDSLSHCGARERLDSLEGGAKILQAVTVSNSQLRTRLVKRALLGNARHGSG
jgi:hypothetical protein